MTQTEQDSNARTARARPRLPIGIQTFRTIREEGYYYVDKTDYIRRLIDGGTHCFLSRPRRFGKSLLVDTIKELFEGGEALFRGLAIHDGRDWTPHPVLRLSFGGGDFTKPEELHSNVMEQLAAIERREGVTTEYATASGRFGLLIQALCKSAGQRVVVLVDEYDKLIPDALEKPDIARANRDFLRGLYGTIKDCDADTRFALLTGVSKFSKVSLFSGLNNLKDIGLAPIVWTGDGFRSLHGGGRTPMEGKSCRRPMLRVSPEGGSGPRARRSGRPRGRFDRDGHRSRAHDSRPSPRRARSRSG